MAQSINTNIMSLNAQRILNRTQLDLASAVQRLFSGLRINSSKDDAAGIAVATRMTTQIGGLSVAVRNANDGISLVQTAEGGLNETTNILVRLRELTIQASSDTVGDTERGFLDKEVQQLKSEMQRIAQVTKWGDVGLLDGSTPTFDFQVGINNNDFADRISYNGGENTATIDSLGLASVDYTSKEGAQSALEQLDTAQTSVNGMRANLGALQNRLTSTITNLGVAEENLSAANSRIRDTDVANATAEMTRNSILLQSATSTLAQANQKDQLALKLIG